MKKFSGSQKTRAALVAAGLFFALAQIFLAGHAAQYGDGPHDHGGQACVLSLAAPGGDKLIAATALVLAVVFAVWRVSKLEAQTERARVSVRAARPRGPPHR